MNFKDGLSRDERLKRITSLKPFAVIDNDKASLLRQLLKIAGFIKYYNGRNISDGYFDELLTELKKFSANNTIPLFDGNMEPSQALLYTFLEQLHKITSTFNNRWNNYTKWYLQDVLRVESLPIWGNKVWLSFTKNTVDAVKIEKGFGFIIKDEQKYNTATYKLTESLDVQNIEINDVYTLYFEREKHILPAAHLKYITSVKVKDLLHDKSPCEMMFGQNGNTYSSKMLGLVISRPSLLLQEGKRCVTITFHSENDIWAEGLKNIITELDSHISEWNKDKMLFELFNNVFYVTISTSAGWSEINNYTVKKEGNNLILKFILPEEFAETTNCEAEVHNFISAYPTLRIYPNIDAWLYPYSWLRDFSLSKITIRTSVSGISNIQVYNELGRIDNSKPFAPFGVNTEQGTWFAVGNYEMSLKKSQSMNLNIQWGQLPSDAKGLYGYYKSYDKSIDNRSFRLRVKYLTDYDWHNASNTSPFYLFASIGQNKNIPLPDIQLAKESKLSDIKINRMLPVLQDEEDYNYNIKSRSGFVRFVLEEPETGFGEKYYRQIFARQIMKSAFSIRKQPILNAPISPIIEKMTLDYEAEDVIDLRSLNKDDNSILYQFYPLGYIPAFSGKENHSIPFVYTLDTDANLLLSLKNVKGGEILTLFFNFIPVSKEYNKQNIPQVVWYWGNNYQWQEVPQNSILQDSTHNLLISGCLKIRIPDMIDKSLYGDNGLLWLRAGIKKHEENISELISIHTNAGQLILDVENINEDILYDFQTLKGELTSEKNIPGIESFQRISSFYHGQKKEDNNDLQIRISEYITHRGKAVTARDYERIVLQFFPDIAKVKCLPNFDCKYGRNGTVTLVVIPQIKDGGNRTKPLATSFLMLRIKEYFTKYISAYVKYIDVINPVYEELIVRCHIAFKANCSSALCKTKLHKLFDDIISPWQNNNQLPEFGYSISLKKIYDTIQEQDYVEDVRELSVIRVTENDESLKDDKPFKIYEHKYEIGYIEWITHKYPHIIFVPGDEHLIIESEISHYGIGEITIDRTFIIDR